jgi:hypothetical protein
MNESQYTNASRGFAVLFFVFYAVILASWLFVLFFHFATLFGDDSFVLSSYLLHGNFLSKTQVGPDVWLTVVDIILKINLLVLGSAFGTTFLLYNVLPKMKQMNGVVLVCAFIATYIPSLLTIQSFLTAPKGNWLNNHLSVNEFLILLVMYPLNYAVFFYLYYIVDMYFLEPNRQAAKTKLAAKLTK